METSDGVPLVARTEAEKDPFAAVLEFHRRFGVAVGERPGIPGSATVDLRRRLIGEELAEYDAAVAAGDLVEAADALADLVYVIYGTAVSFGIDLRPVFAEVHRTNMAKVGGGARADGKVLKPAGWEPPRIASLLAGMRLDGDLLSDSDAEPGRGAASNPERHQGLSEPSGPIGAEDAIRRS